MFKHTPSVPSASLPDSAAPPRATPASPPRRAATLGLFGGLLALCGQAACGNSAIEFDLTEAFPTQHISGSGALTTLLPTPIVLSLNVAQQAVMRNANGPVRAVAVTNLALETSVGGSTSASTVPFDFVQSATIAIESTRANSSLPPVTIGVQGSPPGKITGFNLATDNSVNLLPYLLEGAHLISTATGSLPTQQVEYTGSITVHVSTL